MIPSIVLHSVTALLVRLVLGGLFFWSGFQKLVHGDLFVRALANYHLLPPVLVQFYGHLLPWLELIAGVYLILGLFMRFASSLTAGLLLTFLVAIVMILATGKTVDCGCFLTGTGPSIIDTGLLFRDIGLFIGSAYLFWQGAGYWSIDRLLERNLYANSI